MLKHLNTKALQKALRLSPRLTRTVFKGTPVLQSGTPLSAETIQTVKATAPVVAEHGYDITRTMYSKMLPDNPEVSKMFNPTHQVTLPGDEKARQPCSLAEAVHAYAENIDNLEVLGQAVERIAQKHVSLYVLPEQYPVVGENLLWAIKEVLGDAATPEIMQAWEEAYGLLAKIFIDREAQIRSSLANAPGGWEGYREFTVVERKEESSEITSFHLAPVDGGELLDYKPGSYVAVQVTPSDGKTTVRNYTLSGVPGKGTYRITVKRQGPAAPGCPFGLVSGWLHDSVKQGDVLKLGVPCGDFLLDMKDVDPSKPIVLMSGGVGITPVVSMLEYLVENNVKNNIVMVNASRSPDVEAMHDELRAYRRKNLNLVIKTVYDEGGESYPKGPLSLDQLDQMLVTRDCHYYFCGPPMFMSLMHDGLLNKWNVPKNQVHFEYFGPHAELA